jgi:cardiolipin synthase A/B
VRTYPKKVWFFLVVGVVACAFAFVTLFTTLTEHTVELSSTVPLPLGSPDFVAAVESVVRSPRQPLGTDVQLFDDGNAFLADLLGEIGRAEHSVTLTNYIFREGAMANATFEAMTEAARRGVEVRLLLDWQGSTAAPEERIEALEQAGGRVETFRPLSLRYLTRLYQRTHMRAIVVDGEVGYTGGVAFDDGWLGDGVGEEQWRDVMFKYRGELARATQDQFNSLWRQTSGEILSGSDFYPTNETDALTRDTSTARPDSQTITSASGGASARFSPARGTSAASDTLMQPDSSGPARAAEGSWFLGLFHNPALDLATDLQHLVWMSIMGAQERILIATPYMTPDEDVRDAIMAAARRGVHVEVVMPGPYTDAKLIQAATRAYYDELLESGVRIYEYQPGRFHQKTLTADGHWSIIGSANMDNRSATLNVENVFMIEGPGLASALEAELEIAKGRAVEITTASWHPNFLQRFYFNAARIFAKQY